MNSLLLLADVLVIAGPDVSVRTRSNQGPIPIAISGSDALTNRMQCFDSKLSYLSHEIVMR